MKRALMLGMLLAGLGFTSSAQAQIDGALRLHLDKGLISINKQTIEPDGTDGSFSREEVGVGVLPTDLGFGIGYGFSEHLLFDVQATLAWMKVSAESTAGGIGSFRDDTDALMFSVWPSLNYIANLRSNISLFVGGVAGFEVEDQEDVSTFLFGFGPQAGAFFFLDDAVSLDLTARFTYAPFGSVETEGGGEIDVEELDFNILIGISGWV